MFVGKIPDMEIVANELKNNDSLTKNIIEEIKKISFTAVKETSTLDSSIFKSLFDSLHAINGMAIFIKCDIIQKLAGTSERYLFSQMKKGENISEEVYFILKRASEYINIISANIDFIDNEHYIRELNEYITFLENKIEEATK